MHVDLHQRSADKRTSTQPGKGGVPEETDDVHYAVHKLGLCWYFRWSRVGVRKHKCPACGRSDGHGTGLRDWYSVCGTVVHVMVFSTNKFESNMGKTRYKNRKVKRSRQHGNYVRYAISRPLGGEYRGLACWHQWPRSYTKHTEIGERTRRWKDGRWEGVLNSYPLLMMMTLVNAVMNDWSHRKPRPPSSQRPCTVYPFHLCAPHPSGRDYRKWKRQKQS